MNRYRMKYRPAGFDTLPVGIEWAYIELPWDHPNPGAFPHLPSSSWRYGVFTTLRPLTAAELQAFEIEVAP